MRVLLFLSVLLSALTGVGASARTPGMAQAIAERSVQAMTVAPAERGIQVRPVGTLPTLRASALIVGTPLPRHAGEPLWANRRRE